MIPLRPELFGKSPKISPRIFAAVVAALALASFSSVVRAGTTTANLTVQITVTASCSINAATLNFGSSVAGTALAVGPTTGSTTTSVTCSNSSPYSIGMDNGQNYASSSRRMVSSGVYIPYGLYLDSANTEAWTTAATNSACTTSNSCYLGTGSGSAQTINIYGLIPTTASAPTPGTYSDTVTMTITY